MLEPHTETADFYDDLEPMEHPDKAYREAAIHLLSILDAAIAHCMAAETHEIGRLQIKYALGLESRPMRQVAGTLGITVACISRGAKEFQQSHNLPLPPCMKSEGASNAYREARERQLKPS